MGRETLQRKRTLGSDEAIMVLLSLNLFKGNWNSSELEEFVVMFNAGIGYIELRDALHPCLVVVLFTKTAEILVFLYSDLLRSVSLQKTVTITGF